MAESNEECAARRRLTRGYVQVYTGDGKGKTTAALGLALRAVGQGLTTYIGQFMKGQAAASCGLLGNTCITSSSSGPSRFRREECGRSTWQARRAWPRPAAAMLSGDYHLVVLDEINVALRFGPLAVRECWPGSRSGPRSVELVLTGRRAPQALLDRADLVTEMREIKHYYAQNVEARIGIER